MIIFPFGFLGASGEIPGVSYLYSQWYRSLGPSLYWDFDQAAGRGYDRTVNWVPIVTQGWNATGSPVDDTGNADKPGNSSYHRTNAITALGPDVAVSGWAKIDSAPSSTMEFFGFSAGSSGQYSFRWGTQQLYIRSGGVTRTISFAGIPLQGVWAYYAMQLGNGEVRLWINGQYAGQATGLGTFSPTAQQNAWATSGTDVFTAQFDSSSVWAGTMGDVGRVKLNRPWFIIQDYTDYELDVVSSMPIVHYRLGEPSGLPVNLASPGTYDVSAVVGTITQGVTPGLIHPDFDDGCVSAVNGNNHYFTVPTLPNAGDGEDVGMAMFARCSNANAFKVLAGFDAQNPTWELFQNGTAVTLRGGIRTDTGWNGTFTTSACFDETGRYQYGFWCDGPGSNQEIVINAVVIHSNATAGTAWASTAGPNHLLNSYVPSAGVSFGGEADEFSYWYGQGLTLMDFALHNALARKFNDYEFYIAKQTPAFHMRCLDADIYQTTKVEGVIGPNYGTITGSVTMNAVGPPMVVDSGQLAADFAGSTDYIGVTNSTDLNTKVNGSGNVTVSAWAKFDTFAGNFNGFGSYVIHESGSGVFLGELTLTSPSFPHAFYFNIFPVMGTGALSPSYPISSMQVNVWYHFVGTYDSVAGEAKLYVNGQLVSTKSGLSGTAGSPTGQWVIGSVAPSGGGNKDFDGKICHVTVDPENTWDAQQVAMTYYLGIGRNKADAARLSHQPVAYWPMDELVGESIHGYGTSGAHGTLIAPYSVDAASPLVETTDPSINFNGTGHAIGTADFGLNGNTTLTFSAWVRRDDGTIGTAGYIFSKHEGTAGWSSIRAYVSSGNKLRFYLEDGVRNPYWECTYPSLYSDLSANSYNNPWYHIVFVWNRTGGTGVDADGTIYINGRNMRTNGHVTSTLGGYSGFAYTFSETNAEWRIGSLATNSGTQAYFVGDIAKVKLTGEALTDAQVKELYLAGLEQDIVPTNLPTAPITVGGSFTDSFESNTFAAWSYVSSGAQVTITSSNPLAGTYSMQVANGGSADTNPSNPDPSDHHIAVADLSSDRVIQRIRFKAKVTALGSEDALFIRAWESTGDIQTNHIFWFTLARQSSTDANRSIWISGSDKDVAVTIGTEYVVTIDEFDFTANTCSFELREATTGILLEKWYDEAFVTSAAGMRYFAISSQLGESTTNVLVDDIEIIY